ncbi:nucleoside phosphorylase domain-containing protein [Aspergillus leporis]|uniref:Nucleoside phosphorylase domain-containing protein n=1 Tax=Aspergillus leporis TaxID=41062 RepID=A0A5N5X0A7_9EURO|nr:nucleoside phosphorylase domain-containing protein [Aspergillus leporis]
MLATQEVRPTNRNGFEIAIICALSTESDAVEAIFDEVYYEKDGPMYGKAPGDTNSYRLGRIGVHPVVLAYLPGIGKGSSASVAAHVRGSFPNIRLGLVVGICGGVPQPPALNGVGISLGDIIVSTRVVQVDLEPQLVYGFVEKDTADEALGRANAELRAFLHLAQGWAAKSEFRQRVPGYIKDIIAKEGFDHCAFPQFEGDNSYPADHSQEREAWPTSAVSTTALTPALSQIRRPSGSNHGSTAFIPRIHFGCIGSGDLVMKSGLHRDQIAAQKGVIGFEMEGVGVWDNFPTIVIKGVCDYADIRKNDKLHKYASVAAAACTKALLLEWRAMDRTPSPAAANTDQQDGKEGGGRVSTRKLIHYLVHT